MPETKLTKEEKAEAIRDYCRNCNGTDQYYKHWLNRFVYTDGVKFVAETAGAYWLIDAIASHQLNRKQIAKCEGFQVWKLKPRKAGGCVLTCDDGGNGGKTKVVIKQEIEFTDFPIEEIKEVVMYVENDVLLLSDER